MASLVIKIGNTSSVAALYKAGRLSRSSRLLRRGQSAAAIRACILSVVGPQRVDRTAVCSVVPDLTGAWLAAARKVTNGDLLEVSADLKLGTDLRRYPRPRTLGADRIANLVALAARGLFPAIVIDFGTATVFDVINSRGEFIGGVIAPGLPVMTEYLAERTAQLPRIEAGGACGSIGLNTRGAMQIGATVGYRGMVREILAHLAKSAGTGQPHICATGGYAALALKRMSLPCTREPNLTLKGVGRILDLNPRQPGRTSS
jgi:type III pantothenate kinase